MAQATNKQTYEIFVSTSEFDPKRTLEYCKEFLILQTKYAAFFRHSLHVRKQGYSDISLTY